MSCMCMSTPLLASVLPFTRSERRRALAVHAHGGGEPVAIEEELAVGGRAGEAALPGEALVLPGVDGRAGRHHARDSTPAPG